MITKIGKITDKIAAERGLNPRRADSDYLRYRFGGEVFMVTVRPSHIIVSVSIRLPKSDYGVKAAAHRTMAMHNVNRDAIIKAYDELRADILSSVNQEKL